MSRRQKTEDRRQKTGDRRQETEDRRLETEDGRQETEDRRRETGDGRRETGEFRQDKKSILLSKLRSPDFGLLSKKNKFTETESRCNKLKACFQFSQFRESEKLVQRLSPKWESSSHAYFTISRLGEDSKFPFFRFPEMGRALEHLF